MPIIFDSPRLVLNAYAVLIGQTPGNAAFKEHQGYIDSLKPEGYKAALDKLFENIFSTPQLATALLANLGLTKIFTQADAEGFLGGAGNNRIGAMIDLADALYNYTGPIPSLLEAKVAYAKSIDASYDYSISAGTSGVLLSSLVSDTPTFSVTADAASTDEGTNASFTVDMTGRAAGVEYTVTVQRGGTGGADINDFAGLNLSEASKAAGYSISPVLSGFTVISNILKVPASIAGTTASAVFTVALTKDALAETGEGLQVTLSAPTASGGTAAVLSSTATTALTAIADDGLTYTLTSSAATVFEGVAMTYTLTASAAATTDTSIGFSVLPGDAAAANQGTNNTNLNDFAAGAFNPTTVVLAAGATTASFVVTAATDAVTELPENYSVKAVVGTTTVATLTTSLLDGNTGGQTFTLKAEAENLTGTADKDTFSAIIQNSANGATDQSTLNSADTINGGDGADVLNIRVISLAGSITVAPVLTNLETISVTSADGSGNNAAIRVGSSDKANASTITTVEFKDHSAGANTTFLGVPRSAVLSLDNADSSFNGQKVNFNSEVGNGNAVISNFKMTIANGSGTATEMAGFNFVESNGTSDDTSMKTANFTVAGAASFVTAGTALASLTTVNVTGAATGVTTGYGLDLSQFASFPGLTKVDASGLTGGGLNIDARGAPAAQFSFLGGSANDRVVLSNTTINSSTNSLSGVGSGGLGKDTLASTSFNLTASVVNLSNSFEVLESVSPVSSLTANTFTSIHEFVFSGGVNNGRVGIDGVESADRFVFSSDLNNGSGALRFAGANIGQTAVIELRASPETNGEVTIRSSNSSEDSVNAIAFQSGISAVTIDSTGQNTTANLIESVKTNSGGSNYAAFDNSGGLATFVITGAQNLTIGARAGVEVGGNSRNVGFSEAASVDASAFTGNLRIAGSGSNDIIIGGSGNDIIYGVGGADTLTGNGGADQFRITDSNGKDLIKDFLSGVDKVGFNNVNFGNTTATAEGATLASTDYVDNRSGITSIGSSDSQKVIELQSALSGSQIQTDVGAAVAAYVLVFNSTTNKGELWFDDNWSSDGGRSQVATFDNVVTLVGVTAFNNTDFVEFTA